MELLTMSHPFAPGAIEAHRRTRTRTTPAQRRELVRWLKLSALFMAASVVAGLLAWWLA
jgi:hypothetical protein